MLSTFLQYTSSNDENGLDVNFEVVGFAAGIVEVGESGVGAEGWDDDELDEQSASMYV